MTCSFLIEIKLIKFDALNAYSSYGRAPNVTKMQGHEEGGFLGSKKLIKFVASYKNNLLNLNLFLICQLFFLLLFSLDTQF